MSDLTGLPALDVLIGMAFVFFLLATVVSSVNEVIQTVLNARARILTRGIKTLLAAGQGDADAKTHADKFFNEWRIRRLAKPAGSIRGLAKRLKLPFVAGQRRPSYIPARAFALTLLETATPGTGPRVGGNLFDEAEATIGKIGVPSVQSALTAGLTDAERHANAIRAEIEHAFDEVMDRASGWYKRYVQWWLLAIAIAVTIGLNVNAFVVGERLWKDDALRAVVVQQAQKTVGETDVAEPGTATPKTVAAQIDKIDELKLPLGWTDANTKGDVWGRLAGWLVTVAALTLGAPFWFDVLGKLARLRGSGNREGTAKDNPRAPEDRDDASRVRAAAT